MRAASILDRAAISARARRSRRNGGEEASKPKPKQLGKPTPIPVSPADALLERVPNPHPETLYAARFTAPEFTCLCPITGQPDFAHLVIDYAPKRWLLESKSLKLYLASFRNYGTFHEDATVTIGKRIADLIEPPICASAAIGFRAAASPSTCSGSSAPCPRGCGCRTRASRPIAGGARRCSSPGGRSPSARRAAAAALSAAPCWVRRRARGRDPDGSR